MVLMERQGTDQLDAYACAPRSKSEIGIFAAVTQVMRIETADCFVTCPAASKIERPEHVVGHRAADVPRVMRRVDLTQAIQSLFRPAGCGRTRRQISNETLIERALAVPITLVGTQALAIALDQRR